MNNKLACLGFRVGAVWYCTSYRKGQFWWPTHCLAYSYEAQFQIWTRDTPLYSPYQPVNVNTMITLAGTKIGILSYLNLARRRSKCKAIRIRYWNLKVNRPILYCDKLVINKKVRDGLTSNYLRNRMMG
jgi:hypothetical protein